MNRRSWICLLSFLLPFYIIRFSFGDDWPHWRGPGRDGLTGEKSNWSSGDWLKAEPDWTSQVGIGTSAPIIFQGKVYVIGWENDKDILRCLDLATAKEAWTRTYPCPMYGRYHLGEEPLYGGPHSTPEIDTESGLLFTLSIDGNVKCWDLNKQGDSVWSRDLYEEYDVKQRPKLTRRYHRDYGYTTSPLVHRDWVIVEVGSTSKGAYVAFDKITGKEVWRSQLLDEAGHTGGMTPITIEGVPCLAGLTQRNAAVIRLDDKHAGETVAKFPWVTEGDCNIATPVVVGSSVLITSAYEQSAISRFDVTLAGMTEVWRQPFPSKVCTPVVRDGSIYYSWMTVKCLSWATGEKQWEGGSYGDPGSCIITADGRLIVYGSKGKIGLIEGAARSPARFTELAVRDRLFKDSAWPHIAMGSGRLICRDKDGNLVCFSAISKADSEK